MPETPRPLSAEEAIEELHAEALLVEMDLHEELAEEAETKQPALLREMFARQYRELVGVWPEERQELREGLETILAGGGAAVQDVIGRIGVESQRKGSDSRPPLSSVVEDGKTIGG